jgi:hypothetical protein
MAVTRQCDYCEKPESEAGFIQHYEAVPQRKAPREYEVPGQRAIDLCGECAALVTRASEVVTTRIPPRPAPKVEAPKPTPVLMTDASGTMHVISKRNRPNRCTSLHPKSGTRCVWDVGHDVTKIEHRAANGQHWTEEG